MDDKTKGIEAERLAGRSTEYISGREALDTEGRIGQRATSRIPARPAPDAGTASSDARARRLQAEIEQTRGELSETVDAIQERLRPASLAASAAETVKNTVRQAAGDRVRGAADTAREMADMARDSARDMADSEPVQYVRANPIPAAMVGVGLAGLAWLAFGGNEASSMRYRRVGRTARDWRRMGPYDEGDRFYRGTFARRGYAADPADAQGASFGDAGFGETSYPGQGGYETAATYNPDLPDDRSGTFDRAREGGDHRASRFDAAQAGRQAQRTLQRTWQQNPLLMGAASAVLGLMVGMAVPQTEIENEYMGEARDHALEGVQQTVRETVSKVQDAAQGAVEMLAGEDAGRAASPGASGQRTSPEAPSQRASSSDPSTSRTSTPAVRNQEQTPLGPVQPGRNPGIA